MSRTSRACLAALLLPFTAVTWAADAAPAERARLLVAAGEPRVIEWRRHLHANPELSYEEYRTAAYIAAALGAMPGIEVTTGLAKTGVKGVLRGARPGNVVALRADMDALPVEEKSGLPFASKAKTTWRGKESFVAHACGHDTHVAMLLGAAEVLSRIRDDLSGTVVFLFQPAEEWGEADGIPSGATRMVRDGALTNPQVDVVLGQHIGAEAPSGTLRYRKGSIMASGDDFHIVVRGKGSHGAMPWSGRDPILVAAEIALSLQTIVSREANLVDEGPLVVTIGVIQGGNRENIIPEEATLSGTIRTLSEKTRRLAHESLKRKAEKIAEASGLTAEVQLTIGYPVLTNHPALVDRVVPALERAAGAGKAFEVPPIMAAEDFGAYGAGIPTMYWFLAASPLGDRPGPPNHSPFFAIDEKALTIGTRALVEASLEVLSGPALPRKRVP
jgi:amidohydrolase